MYKYKDKYRSNQWLHTATALPAYILLTPSDKNRHKYNTYRYKYMHKYRYKYKRQIQEQSVVAHSMSACSCCSAVHLAYSSCHWPSLKHSCISNDRIIC